MKHVGGDTSPYRLILIGGCRDKDDELRVQQLQNEARRLGLHDQQVKFEVNATAAKIKYYLAKATINLHTMVAEHFGIGGCDSTYNLISST